MLINKKEKTGIVILIKGATQGARRGMSTQHDNPFNVIH